ncbi:protein of unknown function (plasmid) [Cupriavidus taiwanensis]|uniref:Uncharacterized protein n=1 Tax=Cupriavidus taiwanensis TaxID=164546 RepID=A0A375IJE3_9BURK|nr:protein of unknown function [Cupriavidus taiwanensis]
MDTLRSRELSDILASRSTTPLRWRSRLKFDDVTAGERSLAGHEASFASTDAWTLVRPLRSSNRPLFAIASVAFVALRHAFVS